MEAIVSVHAWTEDRDRTVVVTPVGPVFAKRGQVVIVAVLSAAEGARFVTDMATREQASIQQESKLADTEPK
jgi:hypothetical protein